MSYGRQIIASCREKKDGEKKLKGFGADINAAEDIGFTAFTQVGCKIYLRQKNRAHVCASPTCVAANTMNSF